LDPLASLSSTLIDLPRPLTHHSKILGLLSTHGITAFFVVGTGCLLQDVALYCLYPLSAYKMKFNYTSLESHIMNTLETPSFFRPSSRSSSPAPPVVSLRPESGQPLERHTRPLSRLSLGNLIRQPVSQPPSPTLKAPLLVQDGSYLEMLSLKLSEAVSKALAPPIGPPSANEQMEARRIIPAGRGTSLGSLIASYVSFSFGLVCESR
jgi:hypothetical protein